MPQRFMFLSVFTCVVATAAASPSGDEVAKKDLEQMQGVWKVAELTEKGDKVPAKELTPVEVVIAASTLTLSDDGKFREEITLKLDATGKVKTVDFIYSKGANKGKTERGIYAIEGDTLKFCMNEEAGGVRPGQFTSTKTNNCSVVQLQRLKK
jgi:uncharacterized protein (TIGR03067 family)